MVRKISTSAVLKDASIESDDVVIDDGVKLTNVYIKAKKVVIKANAELTECKLFSDGKITIGKATVIKERTIINAFLGISIGDRTVIDRDVFVGGMQSEKSELIVGDDCVVLYRSYLNTTRKITIGSNTGIGGYSKIFTHSSWPNVLKGNPFKFADVVMQDNVWIAWDVLIMPGVVIERDTIVGSGSVVTKSLPAFVVAAGAPAKVIREKKQEPSVQEKNRIMLEIFNDFHNYAAGFLKQSNTLDIDPPTCIMKFDNVTLMYSDNLSDLKMNRDGIAISLQVPAKIKRSNQWIELDSLTAEIKSDPAKHFVAFARRYGIRIKT